MPIGAHVTGATPQVHSLCLVPYAIWDMVRLDQLEEAGILKKVCYVTWDACLCQYKKTVLIHLALKAIGTCSQTCRFDGVSHWGVCVSANSTSHQPTTG